MISTTEHANHGIIRPLQPECNGVVQRSNATTAAALDLCSGLGGISLAAKNLKLDILGGVDVNENALKTFSKNFSSSEKLIGSVRSTKILAECEKLLAPFKAAKIPTVILSGPPCQGFSVAGSRNPVDLRNRVLVAVARAIACLQPDCALVENVSMLLADKYDSRVKKFIQTLNDGGFHVVRIVLDASEFGVSQKRKRAFFLITKQPLDEQDILQRLEKFKTTAVGAKKALEGLPRPRVRPDDYDDENDYGDIHNHFAMQHTQRVKIKIGKIKPGKGPMSYRRLHPERLSNTLFSGHRAPPAHYSQWRSITVREAARLQGFPDNFRVYGSFGNQMEQVTNAVPPPLAQAVLSVLLEVANISICRK